MKDDSGQVYRNFQVCGWLIAGVFSYYEVSALFGLRSVAKSHF
ncbi:hypothetical protein ABES02_18750 [Neobacillus pocheonensis]